MIPYLAAKYNNNKKHKNKQINKQKKKIEKLKKGLEYLFSQKHNIQICLG